MFPISEKRLKVLLEEAENNGRDTSNLKTALKRIKQLTNKKKPFLKEKKSGGFCYSSTGPSKEEDFE